MLREIAGISSESIRKEVPDHSSNKLVVRPMEERDREDIRAVLRYQHTQTIFRRQPFSDEKYDSHVDHVLSPPPRMLCLIAELDGKAVGIAWAGADSYMLADGPLFVTVYGLAVEMKELSAFRRGKAFMALVKGIQRWVKSLDASHAFINVSTGTNLQATDKLLRAAGATCVGGVYVII